MPATAINLLPRKDFEKTPFGRFLRWSLTYGRYIIVSTEIIVLLAFIYRFSLDRKITDLNDEIKQKSLVIEANQKFELQFRTLHHRITKIGEFFTEANIPIQLIHHFEQITPVGVRVESFSYTQKKVSLKAIALTNRHLSSFLAELKKSPLLKDVNLSSVRRQATGTGEISFEVSVSVIDSTEPL